MEIAFPDYPPLPRGNLAMEDRRMEKRPLPVTCCTVCGVVGYTIERANTQCGKRFDGKRCKGTISSALQENDWAECPSCNSTGWAGLKGLRCTQCDGAGWLFARRL